MGEMSVSDLESKVDSLKETAEKYLRDSFGISGNYKETYYSYSIGEGKDTVIMNMVTFQFMMEDDTVYIITLDGKSGILELFKSRSMEEYQRSLRNICCVWQSLLSRYSAGYRRKRQGLETSSAGHLWYSDNSCHHTAKRLN